jgi:hypothetical protein
MREFVRPKPELGHHSRTEVLDQYVYFTCEPLNQACTFRLREIDLNGLLVAIYVVVQSTLFGVGYCSH